MWTIIISILTLLGIIILFSKIIDDTEKQIAESEKLLAELEKELEEEYDLDNLIKLHQKMRDSFIDTKKEIFKIHSAYVPKAVKLIHSIRERIKTVKKLK